MALADVLSLTPQGLYCTAGDFYIDPLRPVARAVITHGHADHARPGHTHVLATPETLAIMAVRYGEGFCQTRQPLAYGEGLRIGDVDVSFHPAGHVLGSAQILIVKDGLRLVVSGDYKRAADPTCAPFELVPCDIFITEATFGVPVYRHPDARVELQKLLQSLRLFPERTHLVGAYALGKAQRLVAVLRQIGYERPIYIHGAMEKLMALYAEHGIALGDVRKVAAHDRAHLAGEIVICPPSSLGDVWSRKFPEPLCAVASGWMRIRARARQRGVELPLIVSDHADWDGLCQTIVETGCSEVWVTHGQDEALVHWATLRGLKARPLHLLGYGEDDETVETPDLSQS